MFYPTATGDATFRIGPPGDLLNKDGVNRANILAFSFCLSLLRRPLFGLQYDITFIDTDIIGNDPEIFSIYGKTLL